MPVVASTFERMSVASGANRRLSVKATLLLTQLAEELGVDPESVLESTATDAVVLESITPSPAAAEESGGGLGMFMGELSTVVSRNIGDISERLGVTQPSYLPLHISNSPAAETLSTVPEGSNPVPPVSSSSAMAADAPLAVPPASTVSADKHPNLVA